MMFTCYLIHHDPHAITIIEKYIKQTTGLDLIDTEYDLNVALTKIMSNEISPDITFIDIALPDGPELARQVAGSTGIIILSSDTGYGPLAYELDVLDYMINPLGYTRFLQGIEKARNKRLLQATQQPFYFVPGDKKGMKIKINKAEVHYIEAHANYIKIVADGKHYLTYLSLKDTLLLLSDYFFARVHKSYIVNIRKIKFIDTVTICMENGMEIPIGASYKESFLKRVTG